MKDCSQRFSDVNSHTSGSTGIPKPITWTHETIKRYIRAASLNAPEGYISQETLLTGKRQFLCLPLFHAAGLASLTFIAPPAQMANVCPISGIPTAEGLVAALKQTPFDGVLVTPSVVLELARAPELLDYASHHLEYIAYCGGDLPQAVGEIVAARIRLINQYGASEMGLLHLIHSQVRDPVKDWGYIEIHPSIGAEYRPVTETQSELVIVRGPEVEERQMPFTIFHDLHEYHTKDLFVRHPDSTKPNLWRWSGRLDDIITFLNGEKTNPVSMEQHIVTANADVLGALVAGSQRFQASLLIELVDSSEMGLLERWEVIERLWPSIEAANSEAPAHARISKTHILFTTPDRPFPRAGKGTIQRAAALTLYAPDIDALYASNDTLTSPDNATAPRRNTSDLNTPVVLNFIKHTVTSVTKWDPNRANTESFFDLGLDSLQVLTISRALRDGLELQQITPNLIYTHPSLQQLTKVILELRRAPPSSIDVTIIDQRETLLRKLLSRISSKRLGVSLQPAGEAHTIILTGSTGSLGTYILVSLLQNPSIAHIHCLNRSSDKAFQQQRQFNNFHLSLPLERVTFHTADLSKSNFNLSHEVWQTLHDTTTLVIHAAWPVNWTAPLRFFEPILTGTVNLINFCADASHAPRIFFISSIGSVANTTTQNIIPEQVIQTTIPAATGYFNSKYIAEHLVYQAAKNGALRHAAIARVGQVAGPVRAPGQWKIAEWFPSLVESSAHLAALPDDLGPYLRVVDWVPVDMLADVLIELALRPPITTESQDKMEVEVYHPHNLHAVSWSDILPVIADSLGRVEIIPFPQWVQRMRKDIETAKHQGVEMLQTQLEKNPAARLMDFWKTNLKLSAKHEGEFATTKTAEHSALLRKVPGVNVVWVQKWMEEWK